MLLGSILVPLAAGFLDVGDGASAGTDFVAGLLLSAMLWVLLLVGGLLLFGRL